jgi:hypothetical protein
VVSVTDAGPLTREQWERVLADTEPATYGELVATIEERDLVPGEPVDLVDAAIEDGPLTETDDSGAFTVYALETVESDGEDDREADQTDTSPTPDADETASSDGRAALEDAVRWFHEQLDRTIADHTDDGEHPERATTAREYWEDVRGLDEDTVDEKLLGWAPPEARDQLLDHLLGCGHEREDILASGLFTDDLDLLWRGRYVLPYFDEDDRVAYAISRVTGGEGGGAVGYGGHPEDVMSGKYAKLAHTKEYVDVDEPIYGLPSLEDGEDVIITEGILDAITAHEAGYACLSPVTTQFKHRHREALLAILDERDVGTVYVLQDAEPPTSDLTEDADGWDALTIEQFGEGVKGGAKTAGYLAENDVDARLAELPRPGLDKVDLDDYLHGWADTLAPILATAVPPEQHPAYDPQQAAVEAASRERASAAERAGDGDTALFDLAFVDVAGVSEDYRGVNPLGHHGDSENYFTVLGDGELGFDHKHKAAYNGLTYLLVEAGERQANSPNGRVEDDELLTAWVHAKREGHLGADDPVPHAALQYLAVDRDLCDHDDLTDGWRIPAPAYNAALDLLEDEFGVDPARRHVGSNQSDGEPVTPLPLERLAHLDRDAAKRYAKKHGREWPSTKQARKRLKREIRDAMRSGSTTVIDAPTAIGKSFSVATTSWLNRADVAGEAPVVHFHETHEVRDSAAEDSNQANVSHRVLKGRSEACPLAAGRHDPADEDDEDDPDVIITKNGIPASEWFDAVCDGRGVPFSTAHAHLREHNDQNADLPCQEEGECDAIAQWEGVPRDDGGETKFDIIHATHQFAHVPGLQRHTNMIFDERPDFTADLPHDRIRRAVTAYLKEAGAPVSSFEGLVTRARRDEDDVEPNEHAEHQYVSQALDHEPDREWFLEADGAHTLAPALTRGVWYAIRDGADDNERFAATVPHEPPRLDAEATDDNGWNREYVTVVVDQDNTVRKVRTSPDLSLARSVIGLDAHPAVTLWQRNVHPDIKVQPVLDIEERALWRLFERGLLVAQVGDAVRPYASGEYFDPDTSKDFLEALREKFGEDFSTAITASAVESQYANLMEEAGVDDPETMHYGEEKSRDDFASEDIGAVDGSIDPGDDYVLDILAEAGLDATPETSEGDDGEEYRARGRGFDGPDAELADEILASVREQHVAQAAGRYARNADDPEDTAIVFVRTSAMPPGFADIQVPGVKWATTDTQEEIVDELRDRESATAKELAEATGASKEWVAETLSRLAEGDIVDCREGAGKWGADLYSTLANVGLAGVGVDLEGEHSWITNSNVWGSYTWSLAICSTPHNETLDVAADQGADEKAFVDVQQPTTKHWMWRPIRGTLPTRRCLKALVATLGRLDNAVKRG